jgi:hypothetical protein
VELFRGSTPWRRSSAVDLAATVLASTPNLPGAACGDHVEIFDAAVGPDWRLRNQAAQRCVEVCNRCPMLARCKQFADGLPTSQRRRMGVLAGEVPDPLAKTKPKTIVATGIEIAQSASHRLFVEYVCDSVLTDVT